jgi:hypothetical protein
MSMLTRTLSLRAILPVGILLIGVGSPVFAQGTTSEYDVLADDPGAPPFTPTNEVDNEVDQDLDEALRREYDESRQPPPPPPPIDPDLDPPPSKDKGEDEFRLRLRGYAGHYASFLDGLTLSYREGLSGGEEIEFGEGEDLDDDQDLGDIDDVSNGQLYRGWIDLGKYVSIYGGYLQSLHSESVQATDTFTFGRSTFLQGDQIDTRFELRIADLDFVINPVNNRYFTLELHVGARYVFFESRLRTVGGLTDDTESSRLETVLPMIGIGMQFRPIQEIELFVRGRFGHFSYERDAETRVDSDGDVDTIEYKDREATSMELDAGVMIVLFETIGVVGGYRIDYLDLERDVDSRGESVEAFSHGVYAGVVLDF